MNFRDTRRKKKYFKFSLYAFIVLFIFAAGVSYLIYTWHTNISHNAEMALTAVNDASALLDKSLLSDLEGRETDAQKAEYGKLKQNLSDYAEQNAEVRFAYILVMREGKLFFAADSEGGDSIAFTPPGQEYRDAPQEVISPFLTGKSSVTKRNDYGRGKYITALSPIRREDGEIIAVFAIDYTLRAWYKRPITEFVRSLGLFLFFGLALLFALRQILKGKTISKISNKLAESEEMFRSVFEQAPVGIAIGKNYHLISHINGEFERILGRTKEEIVKMDWREYTHPDDVEEDSRLFSEFKSQKIDGYSLIKRFLRPDNTAVWTSMSISSFTFFDSNAHLCLIKDINEEITARKAFEESEKSKSLLLSHLNGMAYRCNYDEKYTMLYVSEGSAELTGYSPGSLIGNSVVSYKEIIKENHREFIDKEWERAVKEDTIFKNEYEIITAAGKTKWVMEIGKAVPAGNKILLEGIIIDFTEQKLQRERIDYIIGHDFLTGLYTRPYLERKIEELDKPENLPISMISGDINGLKKINDAFGHAEGDAALKECANIIKNCCPPNAVVARSGGDSFTVLLPKTDYESVRSIVKNIENACKNLRTVFKDKAYDVKLTLGYATKTADEDIKEIERISEDFMLKKKVLDDTSFHSSVLNSIMVTLFEKSSETREHAERLVKYSLAIGRKLNLSEEELNKLELLALLHDIGKVGIDDRILNKAGKLTEQEREQMKEHSEIGYRIANTSPELKPIAEYILHHHERWDGTGYPNKLTGEMIPLASRILAVADAYDAMTKDRVYRKAMTKELAAQELKNNAGTQFDPNIVEIMLHIINKEKGAASNDL